VSQLEPASFINKLFLFFSLPAVFARCSLNDKVKGKAYLYSTFNETSPQGAQVWIKQGYPWFDQASHQDTLDEDLA